MVVVDSAINDFYVDDLLKSMGDEEKAVMMVEQLRDLMSKGGFRLTKWISNNRTVLASIEEKERAKQVRDLDLNFEALPTERALGVYWDVEMDKFSYHIVLKERPFTRRGLLSVVSSMYDPLGFASPFIMPAKKLIKDLSRAKLGWDNALSSRDLDRWECWKNELAVVEGLQVDRCIKSEELGKVVSIQLHHFSDASESAYGACSYIRGLTATELIENERWFSGPSFLRKEEDAWPAKPKLKQESLDNDPEIRKSEKCMAVKEKPVSVMDLLIDRRSSWYRLKKDVAWFIRFQKWIKFKYGGKQDTKVEGGRLTVEEMRQAEIQLVRHVQRQAFPEEYRVLGSLTLKETATGV